MNPRRYAHPPLLASLALCAAATAQTQITLPSPPPAAANCAALRSGVYRLVSPQPHATLAEQTDTLTIDAVALTVAHGNGAFETWAANGACAYLGDGGRTEAAVSPAGMLMLRWSGDNGLSYRWGVAFPEQRGRLRRLAGDWNFLGLVTNAAATGYTAVTGSATIDTAGVQSTVVQCRNDSTWGVTGADCAPVTTGVPRFTVDRSGGLALVDPASGAVTGRAFVYRPRGGSPVMALVTADGGVQFGAPASPTPLPVVGDAATSWNLYSSAQLLSTQTIGSGSTASVIQSVDAATGSWVRVQKNVGQTNDHPETIAGNDPRPGYNFRPQQTSVTVTGATISVGQWTSLPLPGMGFGVFFLPGPKLFALSARQP